MIIRGIIQLCFELQVALIISKPTISNISGNWWHYTEAIICIPGLDYRPDWSREVEVCLLIPNLKEHEWMGKSEKKKYCEYHYEKLQETSKRRSSC